MAAVWLPTMSEYWPRLHQAVTPPVTEVVADACNQPWPARWSGVGHCWLHPLVPLGPDKSKPPILSTFHYNLSSQGNQSQCIHLHFANTAISRIETSLILKEYLITLRVMLTSPLKECSAQLVFIIFICYVIGAKTPFTHRSGMQLSDRACVCHVQSSGFHLLWHKTTIPISYTIKSYYLFVHSFNKVSRGCLYRYCPPSWGEKRCLDWAYPRITVVLSHVN